jgi:hypothetical protein
MQDAHESLESSGPAAPDSPRRHRSPALLRGILSPVPAVSPIQDAVARVWGYDALRPMQAAAIAAGVEGRDSPDRPAHRRRQEPLLPGPPARHGRLTHRRLAAHRPHADQVAASTSTATPPPPSTPAWTTSDDATTCHPPSKLVRRRSTCCFVAPERLSPPASSPSSLHWRTPTDLGRHRHRRSPLHQPVGPRLPPRVPPPRRAARSLSESSDPSLHRHRNPARARRHRPPAQLKRPAPQRPRRHLRPPQPHLPHRPQG